MGTKRGPEDCRKAWKRSDYNRTDIAGYPMGTIAPAWGLNLRLEDSLKETLIRGYIFSKTKSRYPFLFFCCGTFQDSG